MEIQADPNQVRDNRGFTERALGDPVNLQPSRSQCMSQTQDQREANKRAAHQVYDVWDGGDIEALDDIITEDVVFHGPEPVGTVHGREAYKDNLRMIRAGFPDLSFEAHDVVAEGDTVMANCTFGGTHNGELMGIEPTGTSVEVRWFGSYRFDDGELVEVTGLPDLFGAFLQVGAIDPPGSPSTTEAENKEIARTYAQEVISEGNLALIDELFADDYVEYNSALPEPIQGPEGVKEYVTTLRSAVPDIDCVVEDLIAEGDMVVRRDQATGTHEGGFMGVEATGKAVVEGHHIHRIEDGQFVESWAQNDVMGLLMQLGAVEPPGE
ncbi:ester cyclase [Natronococcus pandeyae]|nr:ester cyclase [Natronococcus pandeyae]